jgi:hypothetical protein
MLGPVASKAAAIIQAIRNFVLDLKVRHRSSSSQTFSRKDVRAFVMFYHLGERWLWTYAFITGVL